ncbi:hypothetical protein LCGC14_2379100 [marine sediment metagenome]|uniref:Uncharacterized protein n=1 Tax=marine sediment metagenome TaxID=412755 RepID=A0A0F9C1K8_9ZZZZ
MKKIIASGLCTISLFLVAMATLRSDSLTVLATVSLVAMLVAALSLLYFVGLAVYQSTEKPQ